MNVGRANIIFDDIVGRCLRQDALMPMLMFKELSLLPLPSDDPEREGSTDRCRSSAATLALGRELELSCCVERLVPRT